MHLEGKWQLAVVTRPLCPLLLVLGVLVQGRWGSREGGVAVSTEASGSRLWASTGGGGVFSRAGDFCLELARCMTPLSGGSPAPRSFATKRQSFSHSQLSNLQARSVWLRVWG